MSFWGDDFGGRERKGWFAERRQRRKWEGRNWLLPSVITLVMALSVMFMLLPFFIDREEEGSRAVAVPVLAPAKDGILDFNKRLIQVADLVKPAVVSVINHPEELEDGADGADAEMFGLGSGVIFEQKGDRARIVTNQHVIEGGAEYEVVLSSGERRKAKLIGEDVFTDLAVLEIDAKGITRFASFGDSDQLEAGESVVAIGNPLGISYSQTITAGIVSSLRTKVPVFFGVDGQIDWEVEMIQTDAAINRGNSGGALVNLNGEVIGINSMKVTDFGVEGLGFAIPINEASLVIDSLIEHGKVKRPFIGVSSRNLSYYEDDRNELGLPDDVEEGAFVISAEGPAKKAGLKSGDVIVQFDNAAIDSTLALRKYLYEQKEIGDTVEVVFYRGEERLTVTVELGEREEE